MSKFQGIIYNVSFNLVYICLEKSLFIFFKFIILSSKNHIFYDTFFSFKHENTFY